MRHRQCNDRNQMPKTAYPNRHAAAYAARNVRAKYGVKLKVYACAKHGYHIGHRPAWTVRRGLIKREEDMAGKLVHALRLVLDKGQA